MKYFTHGFFICGTCRSQLELTWERRVVDENLIITARCTAHECEQQNRWMRIVIPPSTAEEVFETT